MITIGKLHTVAAALVLASSGCAYDPDLLEEDAVAGVDVADEAAAIIGGADATVHELPWQVDIQYRPSGGHSCGGTVVSESWIVTAAHCVEGYKVSQLRVVAGITNRSDASTLGQIRHIAEIRIYPAYVSPYEGNDLALVGLSAPLDLSGPAVTAIGLLTPADAALAEPGRWATISGWGANSATSFDSPDILQRLYMPIISNETAETYYSQWHIGVYDYQLAAGYMTTPDINVCGGDSGGPLIVRKDGTPLLIGVPSLAPNPCGAAGPALFTRISSFIGWLTQNIGTQPIPLATTPNVYEPSLAGAAGSWVHFQLDVPAGFGRLTAKISDGLGDADLYLRYGAKATTTSYGCRPYKYGNDETCTVSNPAAGTWYISVRGYKDFSNVNLFAQTSYAHDETNLSGSTGSWTHFQLEVPTGFERLVVTTSGGTGDANLYLGYGIKPTTTNYWCRATRAGSDEKCTFNHPSAGTWYISLYGHESFAGVSMSAYLE